jgi:tRNA-splicing ligase RtcB
MGKLRLRGKDLRNIGLTDNELVALAIQIANRHCKRMDKDAVLGQVAKVLQTPTDYALDPAWSHFAEILLRTDAPPKMAQKLRAAPLPYARFGAAHIEAGAIGQMDVAMRLPVAVGGALMPDAHHGYGLPIGGVLATEGAVIPYGVGVDIGCRMCLSIFEAPADYIHDHRQSLKSLLEQHTFFGHQTDPDPMDDAVLEHRAFQEIPFVKKLKNKAFQQIGSSGSGNHFVEFGIVEMKDRHTLGLPDGPLLALLSHSGSRGLGATIAQHYTKIAMEKCLLPKEAQHLAWLSLDDEDGQAYWRAMQLAGNYAAACHAHIHQRLARELGMARLATIENHHNFAWEETLKDGRKVVVHRKGATPAKMGEWGIIPGSMTAKGYIVRGKGEAGALWSASHGAGRLLSRQKAKSSFTKKELLDYLKMKGVELIGGDVDESPFAYKNIEEVMGAQSALVEVVGSFTPKIVRMDGN